MDNSGDKRTLTPARGLALAAFLIVSALVYALTGTDLTQILSQPSSPPTVAAQNPPTVSSAPRSAPATITPASAGRTAPFDFYVLSLSWSPDYCASSGTDDPQQCSLGKRLGFVLHGLWPQYNRGYPSDCSTVRLPPDLKTQFAGLYPSTKLYDHEWEKHGTCSGLAPEQFLALSKRLKESVVVPVPYRAPEQPIRVTATQLKTEFIAVNPLLSEPALAANCSGSGRFLQELYICFTPDGKPTACSSEIHNDAAHSCQSPDFLIRNVK